MYFGGGDSALGLDSGIIKVAKKIILIHRRDEFRAAQHPVGLARDLEKKGKVEILTCYQPLDL